jgi:protein-tyrosine phosphatase
VAAPETVAATFAIPSRHLPLPGTHNVRDIGGYATRYGTKTRWRTLLRSDSPHRLSVEGKVLLLTMGLQTVLDLRHATELAEAPSVFLDSTTARYVHHALLEDPALRAANEQPVVRTLEESYRYILESRSFVVAAALRRLAEPGALPGLVNCTAGKDRTGIIVGLALAVAGVPDEVIAEDFELSATYLTGTYFDEARIRAEKRGIPWERYQAHLVCPAPLMLGTLTWLREQYGSPEQYLAEAGFSELDRARLRNALTE